MVNVGVFGKRIILPIDSSSTGSGQISLGPSQQRECIFRFNRNRALEPLILKMVVIVTRMWLRHHNYCLSFINELNTIQIIIYSQSSYYAQLQPQLQSLQIPSQIRGNSESSHNLITAWHEFLTKEEVEEWFTI